MATRFLGRVGVVWLGEYAGGTAYDVLDMVRYGGSSYICTAASTGNLPTDTDYWALAASGADYTGSPAGTYADLAALNAADPDHLRVYITLDDGKWCYYDSGTSAFVAGDTYQSVVLPIDTTLTQTGEAAEAETVGDAFGHEAEAEVATPFDSVTDGYVYADNIKTGSAWASGRTSEIAVTAGEKYLITTKLIHSVYYGVCIYYNAGGWVSSEELWDKVHDTYVDHPVTIPAGVTIMRCCTYVAEAKPTLKKLVDKFTAYPADMQTQKAAKRYYATFDGDVCYVKTRYSDLEDIVFKLMKPTTHGNGLPDFERVYTVARSDPMDTQLTMEHRALFVSSTDMFSPHIVKAVANGDGDHPTDVYFTGGNHRSNNDGTGAGATAECTAWTVYADGAELSGAAYADSVAMVWTNNIQAYNTTKTDGSGREVLQEDIRLDFDGARINATVVHTALEAIERTVYYGLQLVVVTSEYTSALFAGSRAVRAPVSFTGAYDCQDMYCRDIILRNASGDRLRAHIDELDLGDFSNCVARSYSAFLSAYDKLYFDIIYLSSSTPLEQATNEMTYTSGYYDFYTV